MNSLNTPDQNSLSAVLSVQASAYSNYSLTAFI